MLDKNPKRAILLTVTLVRPSTGSVLELAITIAEYEFLLERYPGWELSKAKGSC
jgi:hypothetical protein